MHPGASSQLNTVIEWMPGRFRPAERCTDLITRITGIKHQPAPYNYTGRHRKESK